MSQPLYFASDNYAGAHPLVLEAMVRANGGHAVSYGDDEVTAEAHGLLCDAFGPTTRAAFVWNGTAANVVSLRLMMRPWQAVVCAPTAHIAVDEAGAPEFHLGSKLLLAEAVHGKLTPESIAAVFVGRGDQHKVQPRVLSISQSTELGTVYSLDELASLTEAAHGWGLLVHLDGARLANAAASLGTNLGAITTEVGVDVVSFGGTKNGLVGGEAVVVLNPELGHELAWVRKQSLHLASKMRFIAAQFTALLTDDLWLRNALHANAMAQRLAAGVGEVPGVHISRPVDANAVFACLPAGGLEPLLQKSRFYEWDETTHEVRWMCSWQTTPEEVDAFIDLVRQEIPRHLDLSLASTSRASTSRASTSRA